MMGKEYRRELISILCDKLIPLFNVERGEADGEPWHEECHDLEIKLRLASDWFRQTPRRDDKQKGEEECS